MARGVRPVYGGIKWLRRMKRLMQGKGSLMLVGLVLAFLFKAAEANTADYLAADEATANRMGYKRIITTGNNGDFVVEFYHNNGSDYCDSFILVPAEGIWHVALRGFLYLMALLYTFLGIAIVSDIFMASIERITAARTEVKINADGTRHVVTVVVWNETVANLTLMALGSSAPEILISVVETVQTLGGEPGELGPSTIVGSAAFNLFVITGVCVYFAEETPKKVKEVGVFCVTSFSSIFAYLWLIFTLQIWTPDEVTIPEAVMTLLFFPLLVGVAWCQDRGWFRSDGTTQVEQKVVSAEINAGQMDRERIQELWKTLKSERIDNMDAEGEHEQLLEKAKAVERSRAGAGLHAAHWSRAAYRMNAVRVLAKKPCFIDKKPHGDRRDSQGKDQKQKENTREDVPMKKKMSIPGRSAQCDKGIIEWSSATYSVVENEGTVKLSILRRTGSDDTVTVRYHTKQGTALPLLKYEESDGVIVFEPCEVRKDIYIKIIDDKQYQENQYFFVILDHVSGGAMLGDKRMTEVTIIDDDQPGQLEFLKSHITFHETVGPAIVPIVRRNGGDGKVAIKIKAVDASAVLDKDYVFEEQIIELDQDEMMVETVVEVIDECSYDKSVSMQLVLSEPKGGAILGKLTECTLTITNDPEVTKLIDKVIEQLAYDQNVLKEKMGTSSWGQSFRDALTLSSEDDDLTTMDFVMHFLTIFWKVIFAMIPPTEMMGGWATFCVALFFIGVIVVIVGQLAGLFGCVCGLPDPVTAITFVALGTSLPDMFASKTAVAEEEFADAAIGNVTGSNSVNVFLGMGLPWVLASIYYEVKDEPFRIPAGDLAFSVIVFVSCALICLATLAINRNVNGGELGGPWRNIILVFFCVIWVTYVVLSSLKSTGKI
eukprot:TRINITY_DN13636_c0_g1_i5.p1 TRINITY_DN13636_c0_g1~~TRINITY_DN13636_c0_g1_i5.p1  ORF type:complete len:885 (+),score=205.82 TRINITY_DN13636_c0_g1_i5:57-2711(+)